MNFRQAPGAPGQRHSYAMFGRNRAICRVNFAIAAITRTLVTWGPVFRPEDGWDAKAHPRSPAVRSGHVATWRTFHEGSGVPRTESKVVGRSSQSQDHRPYRCDRAGGHDHDLWHLSL